MDLLSQSLILNTDSYKVGHWMMLPKGITNMLGYIEARGTDTNMTETVFWGLQSLIKRSFMKPVTAKDVRRAKRFVDAHIAPGAFNEEGWNYIVEQHGGLLPIRIAAVPEGTVMSLSNVLCTIEVTDPKCAWLETYFEPLLLQVWYATTVASISWDIKKIIKRFFEKTVDDDKQSNVEFKLIDFGFRGVGAPEEAENGGSGHLLSFAATDNMRAVASLYDYYGLDEEDANAMPGFSVLASEHSVMCANSDADRRDDAGALEMILKLLESVGPGRIVANVIDTYDTFRYVDRVCEPQTVARIKATGSTLVMRPDSGPIPATPVAVVERLLEGFGYTINSKGYKVLPDCIRVLQGDGVNADTITKILEELEARKISADNITFGMGGALLQHCDRDWFKFAMKASWMQLEGGVERDLFKDPVTDSIKRSKKGRVVTYKDSEGKFFSDRDSLAEVNSKITSVMRVVFENGKLLVDEPFGEIKQRLSA